MEVETLADIKLAGRAINDEWPVSVDLRTSLIQQMRTIAESGDPELRIAAAKVVLAADALNTKKRETEQKRLEAEHARKLQLIDAAVRLGIVKPVAGTVGIVHSQPSGSGN